MKSTVICWWLAGVLAVGASFAPGSVAWADAKPRVAATDEKELRDITFKDLTFEVAAPKQIPMEGNRELTVPSFNDQIPERIRELDGKRVRIRGYMMPTVVEGKGVKEFLVVVNTFVCCYGQTPNVHEYIVVKMNGKLAPILENVPLRFEGTLKVGDIYENGYWTGIYAMECNEVKT